MGVLVVCYLFLGVNGICQTTMISMGGKQIPYKVNLTYSVLVYPDQETINVTLTLYLGDVPYRTCTSTTWQTSVCSNISNYTVRFVHIYILGQHLKAPNIAKT